jgi:general stress protein YciG
MANTNQGQGSGQRSGQQGGNLSPEARSKGGQNSPGNFKNNPQRAAEAGRKGGEASASSRSGGSSGSPETPGSSKSTH